MLWSMSSWWLLLALLNWYRYPIFWSSYCKSSVDPVPVDFICWYCKWVAVMIKMMKCSRWRFSTQTKDTLSSLIDENSEVFQSCFRLMKWFLNPVLYLAIQHVLDLYFCSSDWIRKWVFFFFSMVGHHRSTGVWGIDSNGSNSDLAYSINVGQDWKFYDPCSTPIIPWLNKV